MRRYLLDSGILNDYINRRSGVWERARAAAAAGHPVGTGVPVVGEVRHGYELSRSPEDNFRLLRIALRSLKVWPFDLPAAEEYGRIAADLKRRGRPMQQIDMQIAAIARTLGNCTVVSTDTDLLAVPGLTVENWAA